MSNKPLFISLFFCFFANAFIHAQTDDNQQANPTSYWLKGKIAQSEFEIQLSPTNTTDELVSLSGQYYYLSSLKPLPITGKFFVKEKRLILYRTENNTVKETFEIDNFDGKTGAGSWSKADKKQPCWVEHIKGIDQKIFLSKAKQLFPFIIQKYEGETLHLFSSLPDADDKKWENFSQECEDYNLAQYAKASNIQFDCSATQSNTTFGIQVIPNTKLPTLLCYNFSNGFYMLEENGSCQYQLSVQVFEYRNNNWVSIYQQNLLDKSIPANGCWHYSNLLTASNKISLLHAPSTEPNDTKTLRWEWNGKTFQTLK